MKIQNCVSIIALTLALGGCAIGIKEGSSRTIIGTFTVDVSYQETYRRAEAFERQCHTSTGLNGSFSVSGNVYTDKSLAELRVASKNEFGGDLTQISIEQKGEGSEVSVKLWGVGIWDDRELRALKESITSGSVICR